MIHNQRASMVVLLWRSYRSQRLSWLGWLKIN